MADFRESEVMKLAICQRERQGELCASRNKNRPVRSVHKLLLKPRRRLRVRRPYIVKVLVRVGYIAGVPAYAKRTMILFRLVRSSFCAARAPFRCSRTK